jgi:hypothetical protein
MKTEANVTTGRVSRSDSGWIGGCVVVLVLALAACDGDSPFHDDPRSLFFQEVAALCGMEFVGRTELAPISDEIFSPSPLTLLIEECDETEIRIRFGVGEDFTRSWLLRLEEGHNLLFLQGRRESSNGPALGQLWGGWATDEGSAFKQAFPDFTVGRASTALRAQRIWRFELDPVNRVIVYHVDQDDDPRFRLVFAPLRTQQ